MATAKLSERIINTYEKEREEKKIKGIIPEARFGQNTSEKIYLMAKKYQGISFEILKVEPNTHLGTDYDMIILQMPKKAEGIRRMWLEIEDTRD